MREFKVGEVVNTQGLHGDMRIMPSTFDITRFEKLGQIKFKLKSSVTILQIERVWYHKQFVILKFSGIDTMTDAEKLKGGSLWIDETDALPLENNEYYLMDLIGMKVETEDGTPLGELTNVIETGANDVYAVKNGGHELLIPAIRQCILNVDVVGKKMTVHLLGGMLE